MFKGGFLEDGGALPSRKESTRDKNGILIHQFPERYEKWLVAKEGRGGTAGRTSSLEEPIYEN